MTNRIKMLGVVIVNYKTIDRTSRYIREEISKIKTPHKTVIVNNGCTDEHSAELSGACNAYLVTEYGKIDTAADTFVLSAKDNLGYAKGNNLGVEFLNKHFDIEYVLFSNNDIIFHDDDVVEQLISKMEEMPDVGIVGPSVLGVDGKKQNPYVKPSIWKLHIVPKILGPFLILMRKRNIGTAVDLSAEDGYCYRLSGSFMLTRTDIFIKAGMFDPATFLYCEEPILSERYLKFGFKTYFFGKSSVIHEHGFTSRQSYQALQATKVDFHSQLYYFQNYRSISPIVISLAKLSFYIYEKLWYPLINVAVNVKNVWRG